MTERSSPNTGTWSQQLMPDRNSASGYSMQNVFTPATPEAPGDVANLVDHLRRQHENWNIGEPTIMSRAADTIERLSAATAPPIDDENRMEKISALIARLQSTLDRWGDTCVYIRRGGLSWGAVALNRRDDDEKHGIFDLQAQHDRDMLQRVEQVERLIKDRNEWRDRAWAAEAALPAPVECGREP